MHMKSKKEFVKRTVLCVLAGLAVFLLATVWVNRNLSAKSGETALANRKAYAQNSTEATLTGSEVSENTYDLTVTTFNVGGFAAGIDDGIHTSATGYKPMDAISKWKTLFDYENDCANHGFSSDFYFFQECSKLLWKDDAEKLESTETGSTVMRNDVFSKLFKNIYDHAGINSGAWGSADSNMTMASDKFTVRDITYGTLSGKYETNRRGYMKGYIDVNDVEIAVYNVHLGWSDDNGDVVVDSYYELIDLMNEDEYVIVAGDMNGSSVVAYMTAAGYKAANRGEFGTFNTCVNSPSHYIDNIFVSPNIQITQVAVGDDAARAYSDHFPLTAYIKVNKDAAGVTSGDQPEVGEDGFTVEYR